MSPCQKDFDTKYYKKGMFLDGSTNCNSSWGTRNQGISGQGIPYKENKELTSIKIIFKAKIGLLDEKKIA